MFRTWDDYLAFDDKRNCDGCADEEIVKALKAIQTSGHDRIYDAALWFARNTPLSQDMDVVESLSPLHSILIAYGAEMVRAAFEELGVELHGMGVDEWVEEVKLHMR